MHDYDLPTTFGPSGTSAKRLALANQAGLTQEEKDLICFAISIYHVAIGVHSLDECCMIGGNWNAIKKLNESFCDIFNSKVTSESDQNNDAHTGKHNKKYHRFRFGKQLIECHLFYESVDYRLANSFYC